ncbi:sigma-70 family RNA polymerase sigma factor [Streptomyces sp. NPDC001520]|uniref:sigma-70 family RNA polymerase sigma factor n=1 Tax=Streptomyces sp. NPDC001520 TaxID=3364581 RepID=UPI0036A4DB22
MQDTATVTDELILAAQAGDSDAMWQIVSAHDSLIHGIVRAVAPGAKREAAEDLIQEGRAVLVQRIREYDSTSSAAKLHSYAYPTIRRAVAEAWVRMATGLTIDAGTALRVKRALVDYDGNREAAYLAMHARFGTSREVFMATVDALGGVEWLDAPVGRDDGDSQALTLADTIADPTADVTDPTERRELARWLLNQIATRQSYALRSFYGIEMERTPDADVAAHLRTTPAAVRRLRTNGVRSAQSVAQRHSLAA